MKARENELRDRISLWRFREEYEYLSEYKQLEVDKVMKIINQYASQAVADAREEEKPL